VIKCQKSRGIGIKVLFQAFCRHFSYMDIEQAMHNFSYFGGVESAVEIDFFDDIEEVVLHNIIARHSDFKSFLHPAALLHEPYRAVLIAIARGDRKLHNILRRARIGEALGLKLIAKLEAWNVVEIEQSRESPLRSHPKMKIEKHLRSYRIAPRISFVCPFYHFWFGFVEPYRDQIVAGKIGTFMHYFSQHKARCESLVFEQLSNELLVAYFAKSDPVKTKGSYWDRHNEFDLLAVTQSGKVILGECKNRGRKVCRNELNKLKDKAWRSGIKVDIFALFSRNGFSNELHQEHEENLLLFELDDFRSLC
jgi:uncharacterized protein